MHVTACPHAPDAADLEPGSRIVFRDRLDGGSAGTEAVSQDVEAITSASRITRHGGLIIELGRRPSDPGQAIHITAILTVAQAVGMLFEQAQDEVGGVPPAGLFASPGGYPSTGTEPDAVALWVHEKEEDARRLGVPRLASLLACAGVRGDVETAADQLWTACGY
jgi:hypothetical protein